SGEGERREQLASGEGLEGGDRGAVRRDRLSARADDLADADADRVLDPDSIGGTLIAKERHVTIEIADRGGAGAARSRGRKRVFLVRDPAQAVARTRPGEGDRGDRREVGVWDVHDGRRLRPRPAMAIDQGGAHRSQEAL